MARLQETRCTHASVHRQRHRLRCSRRATRNIFKPFTEVKDLTLGDGLGLPICSLIATKMNGSLTLDTGYSKGARFVLELHA